MLLTSGCGATAVQTEPRSTHSTAVSAVADQMTSPSCSASFNSNGSHEVRHCEYVLPDGRRFSCNMASFQTSAPTISEVEHSKACVTLPRVSGPTASPAVVKAIGRSRVCLIRAGLAVQGGPVPPEGHGPGGPEGELIVSDALIAFYIDSGTAKRAEPEVLHNARGFHGEVERHGAVTVLWLQPPPNDLRSSVHRCVFT
jgi:hypothetical protein